MSSLIGGQGERFTLSRAIDALADSARQAGRPGLVWIVGLLYPSVTLGLWSLTSISARSEDGSGTPGLHIVAPGWFSEGSLLAPDLLLQTSGTLCLGLFFFPIFRLVAGLARIAPPEAWREACAGRRTPRLRTLWKSGEGMTLSVIGLWMQLVVMVIGALFVILLPAELIAQPLVRAHAEPHFMRIALTALLLGPVVLLFASYALSISILSQLALHSLAHNRRGIGSALLHGWRIMRHDVRATVRAVVVDLVLTLALLALWRMIGSIVQVELVDTTLRVVLAGFAGVARASYWARAYRALGGLSPDDRVPGLGTQSA